MRLRVLAYAACCAVVATCPAFGQRAMERGSMAAYRAIVQSGRKQVASDQQWREATKLVVLGDVPDKPRESLAPGEWEAGVIACLERWHFVVADIVGPTDAILFLNQDVSLWLTGYQTKDLVDGQAVRLVGPAEFVGTKSYETVDGGTATVRVVRLVTAERQAELDAARLPPAAAPDEVRSAPPVQDQWRTWKDASGKFSVDAKWRGMAGGVVRLERRDGTILSVPMDRLSGSDRAWVINRVADK